MRTAKWLEEYPSWGLPPLRVSWARVQTDEHTHTWPGQLGTQIKVKRNASVIIPLSVILSANTRVGGTGHGWGAPFLFCWTSINKCLAVGQAAVTLIAWPFFLCWRPLLTFERGSNLHATSHWATEPPKHRTTKPAIRRDHWPTDIDKAAVLTWINHFKSSAHTPPESKDPANHPATPKPKAQNPQPKT